MVVLVPFLLITAVFSRIAIVELNLPSNSSTSAGEQPDFRLEVIVRESGLEIGNGKSIIAALPKQEGEYDLQTLSSYVVSLKEDYPGQEAASVLLEPTIPYDYLIQVMDVVRSVELPGGDQIEGEFARMALFPQISVGEAP
jgi:biopolymer transport protein ExbD